MRRRSDRCDRRSGTGRGCWRELETLDLDVSPLASACRRPGRPSAPAIRLTRSRLRALAGPPAVLYVAGGLDQMVDLLFEEPVAIVGSRRASPYGLDVARSLGRGLAVAGVTVVSGMAIGIDSAAHAGALEAGGPTVAVLPASANRPYPPGKRALHRRIVAGGAAVSEVGPGAGVWRWMFPARNRIIAALAAMTVVVEAGERSGALVTARLARGLGRPVGAVPGRVTTPQAAGPNGLLAAGACVVRGPQDVLDHLFGVGERAVAEPRRQPPPELRSLLQAIAEGHETAAALARAGFGPDQGSGGPGGPRTRGVRSPRSRGPLSGRAVMRLRKPFIYDGKLSRIRSGYARDRAPESAVDSRIGLRRRRRHPGRPQGVRRVRCPRHDRDHRDHRAEHHRRHRHPPDPARNHHRPGAGGGGRHRRRRGQDRDARRSGDDRGGGRGAERTSRTARR